MDTRVLIFRSVVGCSNLRPNDATCLCMHNQQYHFINSQHKLYVLLPTACLSLLHNSNYIVDIVYKQHVHECSMR